MTLRLKTNPSIRNLRNHSSEIVDALRALLADGVPARPDPRRKNFFELEGGCRVFYIYVSPATGKVMLLAVWDGDRRSVGAGENELALAACCASSG